MMKRIKLVIIIVLFALFYSLEMKGQLHMNVTSLTVSKLKKKPNKKRIKFGADSLATSITKVGYREMPYVNIILKIKNESESLMVGSIN